VLFDGDWFQIERQFYEAVEAELERLVVRSSAKEFGR
jgi:hypothetical protein